MFSLEWGGRTLMLETGKLAQLAHGAVRAQYGDTVVLATVTMSNNVRPDVDYFPLMVDYEENLYAAGKIKGSRFIKREGRPSDLAVLNARITDRSLRPLFDDSTRNDVQVILNVLSVDQENDPAYIGLIAASAAVACSPIPWDGPIAGCAVASVDGTLVLNPTPTQRERADYYILAAVKDEEIVMIEAEGKEAADDAVLEGCAFALTSGKSVLELIRKMQKEIGAAKIGSQNLTMTSEEQTQHDAVAEKARTSIHEHIDALFGIESKQERLQKEEQWKEKLRALFATPEEQEIAATFFDKEYEEAFRRLILDKELRVDGRTLNEIRPLSCEVDVLPRTHGSALFQRGETQVLSTITLGAPGDAQIIDGLEPEYKKRFMHHYDFPPFSVGEVRPLRGPSRRDIGHGALAEKALEPMIPPKEEFPYTIRVVSEILMSNGSSSQGSICGSSLALMAAGVPMKRPVAGIAMGLVLSADKSRYKILTDIQGIEDHSGDMDFKIAGTREGITAIQLDIKLGGITMDICRDTFAQAKSARLAILSAMEGAIAAPRAELSAFAPRIETIMIDPEKIGELIGPAGKVINKIIEECAVQIDIEDDGSVYVTATNAEGMEKAKEQIRDITRDIQIGEVLTGTVEKFVTDRNSGSEIGAIVNLGGNKDGMIHISNVCHGRIARISDVLTIGETVEVKVMDVDKEKGRIGLSRKDCVQPGTSDPKCDGAAMQPREDNMRHGGYHRGDRPFHGRSRHS